MMSSGNTILFAGGGTGGHLYPGISVAQALATLRPDLKPLFLCTTRPIDTTILGPTGYEFIPQPIVPLQRSVGGLLKFWKSWRETTDLVTQIVRDRKPVAVLGLGGYAAGVAVRYGAKKGLKAAILNPDVIPGKANQFLLNHVQKVCCQFAQTADHVAASQRSKLVTTGCPIRAEFLNLPSRAEAAAAFGLNPNLATLVITGASQGAKTVNEGSLEAIKNVKLQGWQVLHLAGKDFAAPVRDEYRDLGIDATVLDFTADMHHVWAIADLTISRAGASSCAELIACGIPSILMPYPFHKDMHQRHNAKVLEAAGAAFICDDAMDRKKNGERLTPLLEQLLYDTTRRTAMSTAARGLVAQNAARNVAEVLSDLAPLSR